MIKYPHVSILYSLKKNLYISEAETILIFSQNENRLWVLRENTLCFYLNIVKEPEFETS